ncbi:proliferation marker protein Ki-67 isoform X1 [Micropterus dolomieu]|uniref:proliferation marker protein Ki-67 isoform X1 n=1 Tax=Micropterus dolomieu TaxID=147949 RepID=UPI001E8ED39D|nr:proliferation marker protein Ki-67 isoform X1 [Micropterus dolomieu]XP_045925065.1 proliferation marker protein Ki-67 isoform X1 [Micropterus dolomieu]
MPLHGKIVVIKRTGGDGTEFPLTATCLFGRKPDCDIRIQLPQVSKEHCRIDLNENKEVILTNLSSVNPTRVNGKPMQQSERLKHGDVITVIDRSFRFEYPPAPTPKKRSSIGGKTETFKVLQDQQVGDTFAVEKGDKRVSEVSTDPHLKDGTNHDNIQRSLEKTMVESKEDDGLLQGKTTSPFKDLYQMIKKSLDVKTPRKSSASLLQTPSSRFCTPKPCSIRKNDGSPVLSTEDKSTPKKNETKGENEKISNGTPKSVKKQRRSFHAPSTEMAGPEAENTASPQKRNRASPQRFTVCEVIEQVSAQTPKSPMRRRSKEVTPAKLVTKEQEEQAVTSPKILQASPRNSEKTEQVKETSKKRKSGELAADLPAPQMKRKRVSFGGQLSPELFDKRLPPDSPLRKGAAPRRSLCLSKPNQSLLRRASVIGMIKEFEQEHPDSPKVRRTPTKKSPKSRTPSPKAATPAKKSPKSRTPSPKAATPAKKSPKSRTPSPKAATPAKKSPKSRTPSPKAATPAKKSPKSRTPSPKAATPAKKSPKSRTPSPKAATPAKRSPKSSSPSPARGRSPSRNKVETPTANEQPKNQRKSVTPGFQTPSVQGRFSVSRISTPSPAAENAVSAQVPLVSVTPKIPLRRKSASGKTPSMAKSAVKVMRRRSGISRASMKLWADVVKFGQPKAQVAAPAKKTVPKKTTKKAASKPQTPARELKGHVSTGHANSPVTIVLSRAHYQKFVNPTGAAPRLVANTALLKKNMKMDEDLTGVSEMFKTPLNERKRRSVINETSAVKTPAEGLGTSVVEPSVLNTPEGPGEMMVSPLSVSSMVKDKSYNSEAVQRLLNEDPESSLVSDVPALEIHSDSGEQQCADLKTHSVTTPKQKPELPECLTGVKRIMKTPRQKAEPIEDLRGRLLRTPKQKPEQQECLTGVKRIMKTPQQEVAPLKDLQAKLLETPKALKADAGLDDKELEETPAHVQESEDQSEMTEMKTPNVKSSPLVCLTGIKRIMKTPKERSAPVEDMVGIKSLMKTPRDKSEQVVENLSIKRLAKSPRLSSNAPVEVLEGVQELVEEPLTDHTGVDTNEVADQSPLDCGEDIAKELDFAQEEPRDNVQSDVINDVLQIHTTKEADANEVVDHLEEVPSEHDDEDASDTMETVSQAAIDENLPVDAADEHVSEEQPEVETATDSDHEKKPVRGRRAKTESKAAEDKPEATEHCEDPITPAPVRGRKGKKTEATAPPAVKQTTRSRNAKTTESRDVEIAMEKSESLPSKVAPKPKRGRNAKKFSSAQAEMVPVPESEQSPRVDVNHEANDTATALEKAVLKPKRGRKAEKSVPEQQDVPQADMAKEAGATEVCGDELEVLRSGQDENKSSDAMEIFHQAPVTESLPEVKTATCEVTEMEAAVVQKKSGRGRRPKLVESKAAEDKPVATEHCEDPVVPAPVRGRRGKKIEATALPAVRQTTRSRNAKSQENTSDDQPEMVPQKVVEPLVAEVSTEAVSDQTSSLNTHQEEKDPALPAEAVVKPIRGRKTKQAPVEPPQSEQNEVVSDEPADAQAQKSIPAVGKPRRGRKPKTDTVEQNEVAEDPVLIVETKQQAQPLLRAKRGRNAKEEELEKDVQTISVETAKPQEPVKKLRRTRKAEQDHVEPREEVQPVVPEEAEAPLVAEPVKMNEQATVAAKPRRGGRKAKQDTQECETPVESAEVQEVPIVSSTGKPKRGRRGKQVTEEITAVAPEEQPDHELQAEEEKIAEPEASTIKHGRARGLKTLVKNELPQAIPAKRARRGAAAPLKDTNAESTVLVSESAPSSVQPAKRGRRAAAKPTTDDAGDQANPTEDVSSAVVEDTKMSNRCVKWKADLEVFEIPQLTPVKAVRGRKSKLGDKVDTESKNLSKDANKTEEKDLSDEVVEAQPIKRARRVAKVADKEFTSKVKSVEAEAQPKTRRGRAAKK